VAGRHCTPFSKLPHGVPEFMFWIYPDGKLHDAKTSHRAHPPPGFAHILKSEPDYALVTSDNADIYGTLCDLWDRRYE